MVLFNPYWEDKGVHIFPKGICPKVNVIARLEHELAYYDSVVHRFNHYITRTPPMGQIDLYLRETFITSVWVKILRYYTKNAETSKTLRHYDIPQPSQSKYLESNWCLFAFHVRNSKYQKKKKKKEKKKRKEKCFSRLPSQRKDTLFSLLVWLNFARAHTHAHTHTFLIYFSL